MPGSELDQKLSLDLRKETTLLDALRRPEVTVETVAGALGVDESNEQAVTVLRQLETETKYAGYIKRQDDEIAKIRRHEAMQIPAQLDYLSIDGLSNELRQKLDQQRPASLARAARIRHDPSGVIYSFDPCQKNGSPLNTQYDQLCAGTTALGLSITDHQVQHLLDYVALVEKWNRSINLVSRQDIDRLLSRHVLDSLSVNQFIKGTTVVDVGTGAGFPGIPLAIVNPNALLLCATAWPSACAFFKSSKASCS